MIGGPGSRAILASMTMWLLLAVCLSTGCGLRGSRAPVVLDPSAQYFPKTAAAIGAASTSAAAGDPSPAPSPTPPPNLGPVARPNPQLTPGQVALRDVGAVCQQPKRSRTQIPFYQQQSIYFSYRIALSDSVNYGLDYLVPLQLGGAAVQSNIWPAALRGVGFHQKEQLNYRLRLLVCQAGMPLDQAQQQIVADWYALWIRYATAAEIASVNSGP